jgi:dUTP pyrophosphatase
MRLNICIKEDMKELYKKHFGEKLEIKPATCGSAGIDVLADRDVVLKPSERTIVKTGMFTEFDSGFVCDVRPRSGMAIKYGVTVLNAPGTIDSDYRNEHGIILINHSKDDYKIKKGDKIAQLVFLKHETIESKIVTIDELDSSERKGGFGHTGK